MMSLVVCSTYEKRTIDAEMSPVWHTCNVCEEKDGNRPYHNSIASNPSPTDGSFY